ncbi:hypothetical protein DFQ26_000038 [Actinomortierella ambigua]|nr:hypothetical protein DFQ26_000038 [Actinomortierella ambigua]
MAAAVRSTAPLLLARSGLRVAAQRVCAPAVATRAFRVDVKPTKQDTVIEKDQKTIRIEAPLPAVSAFGHRLGLNKLKDQSLLMRIVTHPSYERSGVQTNECLDVLGGKVLNMYVAEYLNAKYPKLPTKLLKEAVTLYTWNNTLSMMAKEFGVQDVARWVKSKPDTGYQISPKTVYSSVVKAMIGAIYVDQGPAAARKFVHAHSLSRELDLAKLIKIDEPKLYLSFLMKRLGRERPVARLMSETGRLSNAPVFVVGVYSGTEKMGEGYGSSLKMAEHRANMDALTKYYMEEHKDFNLPSDTDAGKAYTPKKFGDSEIIV